MAFTDRTATLLERIAVRTQREGRVPGLAAGVARSGELQWSTGVGVGDLATRERPDADLQYQIASNTKTFVAVTIMALRDEGRLDLDDPVGTVIPESSHGRVTFRQLLAHSSGMQREPVGDVFDTLDFPDREGLVTGWNEAEQVGRPHTHWHYSNLGFAMLGEAVTRLDGGDWFASVQRRILDPLGMRRTTLGPAGRAAGTYFVPPYHDVPAEEPVIDILAVGPAGGMASTTTDLATWGGFVAEPTEEVLHPDTLEEMCQPQILAEPSRWGAAWGLGFMLVRSEDRVWVGHTGGWPGSITGVFTHRESATTGIMLMNNTHSPDPAAAAIELGACSLQEEPPVDEPWTPGTDLPAARPCRRGVVLRGRPVHLQRPGRTAGGPRRGAAVVAPAVGLRAGRGRCLSDRVGSGARRTAATHPPDQRHGGADALGGLSLHPRAVGLRRPPRPLIPPAPAGSGVRAGRV
ncbi:serine hydrolase domain-containing protein [Actinomycetota bacterium]